MFAWTHLDSIELISQKKWHETPDTVSFVLAAAHGDIRFDFKPGQFCSLGFELGGKMEYRAYSISSLPDTTELQFTVKRVEQGTVSNHILDSLHPGDRICALKPAGGFNSVDCLPSDRVTMLSAGCGITPVMAMVKQWLASGQEVDIDFVHMARSKENTIYFKELEQLAGQYANFHLRLLLKDPAGTDYPQGRLDKAWLQTLSPDICGRTVYLCGPVGFMQDMRSYLEQLDFDMSRFFEESFTPVTEGSVAQQGIEAEMAGGNVMVTVPDFAVSLEVEKGSLLIDALEKGSVPVIAACRSGICGSCRVRVKVGEVERFSTETLTDADIELGYALACSCRINSDVEASIN